jgi:hypothetical protein
MHAYRATTVGAAEATRARRLPIFALVATALAPRDHPTIVAFDPGRYRATVPSWTNPDTSRADADRVVVLSAVVAVVVTIPADPHINALGLDGSGERRSRQHCYGCRRDESDLHHWAFLLLVNNQLGPTEDCSASPAVIRASCASDVDRESYIF